MAKQVVSHEESVSPSDHVDSITSAPQPSYASDDAWMHTLSDSHSLSAATRRRLTPDVFSKLSAAFPDLRPLDSGARAATNAEQKITFLSGCRSYPKAMAWSMAISSTIIMEGFDTFLIFSFFSFPTFERAYGVPTANGNFQIPTRWQFALPTASEVGEIVGLLFSGLVADRIGYRFTLVAALIFLFLSIFLSFFAVSLEMLLAGQFLCGIPWGVFQTLSINYAGMSSCFEGVDRTC
jgi:MFS transporter, SP family, general alpha glucoside:H+ symporter